MSVSSHTLNEPLALSALLYSRQLVVLYRRLSGFLLSSALISEAYQIPTCRFEYEGTSHFQATASECQDSRGGKSISTFWKEKSHEQGYPSWC